MLGSIRQAWQLFVAAMLNMPDYLSQHYCAELAK
jgi:hypothetical protein